MVDRFCRSRKTGLEQKHYYRGYFATVILLHSAELNMQSPEVLTKGASVVAEYFHFRGRTIFNGRPRRSQQPSDRFWDLPFAAGGDSRDGRRGRHGEPHDLATDVSSG